MVFSLPLIGRECAAADAAAHSAVRVSMHASAARHLRLGEDGSPKGRDCGTLARFTTAVREKRRPLIFLEALSSMDTPKMKELHAIAQTEFDAIRVKLPSKLAVLASPKLVVLPDRFMAKLGGAAAIYFWTCVGPKLLAAPPEVRRAVIAHEWGHVASGHCNATIGALVGALLYVLITMATPPGYFWPAVNIVILGMTFLGLYWALHGKRELEADDLASMAVGAAGMAYALRWIIDHMRDGEQNEMVRERLRRLDQRAAEEASVHVKKQPMMSVEARDGERRA